MPRLVVRVGTSVDSLVSVPVNTEFLPTTIDSPVFTGTPSVLVFRTPVDQNFNKDPNTKYTTPIIPSQDLGPS